MISTIFNGRSATNNYAAYAGIAVLAGVALVCAIPKTRKACSNWLSERVDDIKHSFSSMSRPQTTEPVMGYNTKWMSDMDRSEHLKGPLKKRKNPSAINVPSAGTSAWRDEWSSE